MKKSLFALAAMASLGLFAFGCGDGESGDACLTSLDCKTEDGYICHPKELTCQPNDGCGLICDASLDQTCNKDNGKCVTGAAAENCHLNGDKCDEGFTCVQDDQGAWACMPDDQKCYNNTVWSSVAEMCVDADSETCEHGLTTECSGDGKTVCDPDLKLCVPRQVSSDPKPYKYVRIDDLTPMSDIANLTSDGSVKTWKSEDPGVDLDAIVLTKAGSGAPIYAEAVLGYRRGDGQESIEKKTHAFDSDAILHAPDSMTTYPSETCNYYIGDPKDKETRQYPFVSLGGQNGWIIVEMGDKIEEGDTLDIIELGDCKLANTESGKMDKAKAESMKVQVSVGSKVESEWVIVAESGAAVGGVLSVTIPELTPVDDDGTDY